MRRSRPRPRFHAVSPRVFSLCRRAFFAVQWMSPYAGKKHRNSALIQNFNLVCSEWCAIRPKRFTKARERHSAACRTTRYGTAACRRAIDGTAACHTVSDGTEVDRRADEPGDNAFEAGAVAKQRTIWPCQVTGDSRAFWAVPSDRQLAATVCRCARHWHSEP